MLCISSCQLDTCNRSHIHTHTMYVHTLHHPNTHTHTHTHTTYTYTLPQHRTAWQNQCTSPTNQSSHPVVTMVCFYDSWHSKRDALCLLLLFESPCPLPSLNNSQHKLLHNNKKNNSNKINNKKNTNKEHSNQGKTPPPHTHHRQGYVLCGQP